MQKMQNQIWHLRHFKTPGQSRPEFFQVNDVTNSIGPLPCYTHFVVTIFASTYILCLGGKYYIHHG